MTRGTRGKAHSQSAFKVAHLAAGGRLLLRTLTIEGTIIALYRALLHSEIKVLMYRTLDSIRARPMPM